MRKTLCVALALVVVSPAAFALTAPATDPSSSNSSSSTSAAMPDPGSSKSAVITSPGYGAAPVRFSRIGLSAGIGAGGINLQAATEVCRHINLRGIGNYFSYSVNNVKVAGNDGSTGVDVSGKLNFAEGGVAMDLYPFPNHGFRLSPGVTFYNQNGATATGVAGSGDNNSITFGGQKYYSNAIDPISVNANMALNTHKQAFSMTTGWGNMISRKGGRLSFPFEIGAIFTGAPTLGLNVAGYGCLNQSDAGSDPVNNPDTSCVNMATNATAQQNIASQITKYQNDVNALKVYPIFTLGVSYNFRIH